VERLGVETLATAPMLLILDLIRLMDAGR
jgi:hypothetical protein